MKLFDRKGDLNVSLKKVDVGCEELQLTDVVIETDLASHISQNMIKSGNIYIYMCVCVCGSSDNLFPRAEWCVQRGRKERRRKK